MRTRALVSFALLSLPMVVSAQITTRRPSTRTPVEPAGLPPAAPEVGRDLAYKRSRWAIEAYSLFSAVQTPSAGGSTMTAVLGAGSHGDYRFSDAFAGTADLTYASMGTGGTSYATVEAGGRYKLPIADLKTRPFVDARATFMTLNDMYNVDFTTGGRSTPISRYSRGLGGFAGMGVEHALTGSFLLTTEVSALRNRMTTYRTSNLGGIPSGTGYWSTTYRFTVGFRYNAERSLHLDQNPRK